MPAKKGSIKRSLGKKALDGLNYVGKNFWKILPVGSGVNYHNKLKNGLIKEDRDKETLHSLYGLFGIFALSIYLSGGLFTGTWTPKQIKEYSEKSEIEKADRIQYEKSIDSSYNNLFRNSVSFEDSLEIYKKSRLPIKLISPTIEEKERAVRFNELEELLKENR
jgi:hypothetical protein